MKFEQALPLLRQGKVLKPYKNANCIIKFQITDGINRYCFLMKAIGDAADYMKKVGWGSVGLATGYILSEDWIEVDENGNEIIPEKTLCQQLFKEGCGDGECATCDGFRQTERLKKKLKEDHGITENEITQLNADFRKRYPEFERLFTP